VAEELLSIAVDKLRACLLAQSGARMLFLPIAVVTRETQGTMFLAFAVCVEIWFHFLKNARNATVLSKLQATPPSDSSACA
jgi:hypothetical protein